MSQEINNQQHKTVNEVLEMGWLSDILYGVAIGLVVLLLVFLSYLSSKKFDMAHYAGRVRYCCAFPDYLSPGTINMVNMAYDFNEVLSKPYRFSEGYSREFVAYYKEYRDWLLCKYFDQNVRFSQAFPNLLAWSKRKNYDRNSFKKTFSSPEVMLLLAQSFYMFSKNDFEHRSRYDISAVECQMRLASIHMMKIIDNNNYIYKYEIADTEEIYRLAIERDKDS